jgi:hypothetical protein
VLILVCSYCWGERGTCSNHERKENGVLLVGKPEGRTQFWRPGCGLNDNIKRSSKEKDCDGRDWMYAVEDRVQWRELANTATKLLVS